MATHYKIIGLNFHFVSQNKDFKTTNGICELCKKSLRDSSQRFVVGKCHHAFHAKCMEKIGYVSCPIDNTVWHDDYKEL
jgi:hypothetical protein